jgi:hypothetical protein
MGNQEYNVSGNIGPGVAIGPKAKGGSGNIQHIGGDTRNDDVRRLVEELSVQIRNHGDELDNLGELNDSVEMIRQELAQPEPRKSIVSVALKGIAASAGSVTAVADAALKVAQLFK